MKPGPLMSTAAQMSSSVAAATTSAATCCGERPTSLANGSAPLAWKSARSEDAENRVGPGKDRVEGGLEALEEDAECVRHASLSHPPRARPTGLRGNHVSRAGPPQPASVNP